VNFREEQLAQVEAARPRLLSWASAGGVPLVRVEFVVPFVEGDHSLHVWLFYDTDLDVTRLAGDGTTAAVQAELRSILEASGYPPDRLADIAFSVDSRENVERNYEGSYFYRLR
jgi:hypothetical protein